LGQPVFEAASIPKFSVIRIPYRFGNDPVIEKLFVVLGHKYDGLGVGYAICIKTTKNEAFYNGNPDRQKGCVYFPAGEISCFPLNTYIQPDNQFPIPHADIEKAHGSGTLKIHGLPQDFEKRLCAAVRYSTVLSRREKDRFTDFLNC
jgi:hypothetical protein